MRLQDLANVHPPGHTQRVQDDLDRRAILQERHILDRHHRRDNALVPVPAGHLVALGQLALLRDADAHQLVDAGGQIAMFFAIKDADVHHAAVLTVGQAQRRVLDLARLVAKDGAQAAFPQA